MKSILDFYGLGQAMPYQGDGQTVSTADFLPAYQRENQYQNSMFGKVANWLEGKKKGLEDASMFNPVTMGLDGLGTMNRWMGASQYPEKLESVDVLAPLGLSAMAAPFMPRLPTMASRDAAVAKSLHATSPQMPERLPLRSAPSEMQTPGNMAAQFDDWESMFLGQSANTNAPRNFSDLFKPKDGATTTVTNAYDAYARFARENGEKAESLPTFSRVMQDLGYPVQRIAGQTRFIGIEPAIFSDTTRSSLPGTVVNALEDGQRGITAYHGSPHDFDKFDMSKIGTGEGAQAFGHGLYFAENEAVASQYRDQLGNYDDAAKWKGAEPPTSQQQKVLGMLSGYDHVRGAAASFESVERELIKSINRERMNEGAPGWDAGRSAHFIAERKSRLDALRGMRDLVDLQPPGRMYEVRINADPEDFLDWDLPLSQQSEKARNALSQFGLNERYAGNTVQEALGAVGDGTTAKLREAGIPGIKYLDQGSRTAGEGSRNYVLFRDDIIEIVKKYGIAAAVSMYGLDAVQGVTNDQSDLGP